MGEFFYQRVGGTDGAAWVLALKKYGFTLEPQYPEKPNAEQVQKLAYLNHSLTILDYPECEQFSARNPGNMFEIIAKINGFHFTCSEYPDVITGANIGNRFRYSGLGIEDFRSQICEFFSNDPHIADVCNEFDLEQHRLKHFYPFRSYSNLFSFTERLVDSKLLDERDMDTVATAILCTLAKQDNQWALELEEIHWYLAEEDGLDNELQIFPDIEYAVGLKMVYGRIEHFEQLMKLLPSSHKLEHIDVWPDDIEEDEELERVKAIKEHFQCTMTFCFMSFMECFEDDFDEEWNVYFEK